MPGKIPLDGPAASTHSKAEQAQASASSSSAAPHEAAAAPAEEAAASAVDAAAAPTEAAAAAAGLAAATPHGAEAATAAAAQAHAPSFFEGLPHGICQELVEFVPRSELPALLASSKGTEQLMAAGVQVWRMREVAGARVDDAIDAAAVRALERSPRMRSFSFKVKYRSLTAHSLLLQRISTDGAFGEQLRTLRIGGVRHDGLRSLTQCLAAGRLPLLEELEVSMSPSWESDDPCLLKEQAWGALVPALQQRAQLGLPPLTSIKGAAEQSRRTLRRLWACCPLERISYLEVAGVKQARALGAFLLAHPSFPALRTLRVGGMDCQYMYGDAGEFELELPDAVAPFQHGRGDGAGVWEALAEGRCPNLESLVVDGYWDAGRESMATLGAAFREGKLPQLASLELGMDGVHDLDVFVDCLADARGVAALTRLVLGKYVCESDEGIVGKLIAALRAGSGVFGHLEELAWYALPEDMQSPLEPGDGLPPFHELALRALAEGAPCARTLRSLKVEHVPPAVGQYMIYALSRNAFPRLAKLYLGGMWVDNAAVDVLQRSLRGQAWSYGPLPLEELGLGGSATQRGLDTAVAAQQLTPAFEEGALPCLRRLRIEGDAPIEPHVAADAMQWVDQWTALGARVRLEELTLYFRQMTPAGHFVFDRLDQAAREPEFCPLLRRFFYDGYSAYGPAAQAFGDRWRVRIARAEARAKAKAAAVQAGAEDLGEYGAEFLECFGEGAEAGAAAAAVTVAAAAVPAVVPAVAEAQQGQAAQ